MLTTTSVICAIAGLAYVGLFVMMALGAASEITTIERLLSMKDGGAQVTNTVEDLQDSISENEMAIVVFWIGAALTVPLVVASLLAIGGRGWARGLATAFLLPPTVVIAFGVIHDINDGHEENVFALVFTVPAIVLAVLWWLPATTRALRTRRPVAPPPQQQGWYGQPPYQHQPHR
ncbi:hypothetical protein BLA60_37625 [Actinophytocola xinjiangensis]|uniref:Uncharacterized protein n=2 Tax=Actinophytocola xinjiangensis TaxID=485602 RepID=A0A7Z0WDX8_9PSEU|nr:hypothetical protein BLA60_37625 [Actinophytocola xinjiangensis]